MLSFEFNLAIPYWVFLTVYFVAVAMLLSFAAASLYHLLRYGFLSPLSVFMTFLLVGGTAFILLVSYSVLAPIDWQEALTLGQAVESINPF